MTLNWWEVEHLKKNKKLQSPVTFLSKLQLLTSKLIRTAQSLLLPYILHFHVCLYMFQELTKPVFSFFISEIKIGNSREMRGGFSLLHIMSLMFSHVTSAAIEIATKDPNHHQIILLPVIFLGWYSFAFHNILFHTIIMLTFILIGRK